MKNNNGFKRYVVPDRAYHTNAEIVYQGNRAFFGVTYRGNDQVAQYDVDLCNVALPRTLLSILVETDLPVDSDAERVVVQFRLGEIVRAAQATHLNVWGRRAVETCTKLRDWYAYGKHDDPGGKCMLCRRFKGCVKCSFNSCVKCSFEGCVKCPYVVIENTQCWTYASRYDVGVMRRKPNVYPAWRDLRIADLTRWINVILSRVTCPADYNMKGVKRGKRT